MSIDCGSLRISKIDCGENVFWMQSTTQIRFRTVVSMILSIFILTIANKI